MAKARSDAWWTKLDDAAQQQAFEMLTHQGLQAGRLALAAKLEIKPPSLSGVSRFYCYARSEESRWRIQKALQDKAYIEKSMTATGDVSALLVKAIGDLTVDATISRDPDRIKSLVESLTSLLSLQYRQKALDLAQQRFQVFFFAFAFHSASGPSY